MEDWESWDRWARYDHDGIAEYRTTLEQVRVDLVASGHIIDGQNQPSRKLEALFDSVPFFSDDDVDDVVPLVDEWFQPLSLSLHDLDSAVESGLGSALDSELDPPDKTAATFLHHFDHGTPASPDAHNLAEAALTSLSRPVLDLKLELPLLKSDPQLDFRQFLAEFAAESRPNPLHASISILPCEPVDDHEDAGLEFPRSSEVFRRRLDDELQHEVLDYSEEHLVLVTEIQYIEPAPMDLSSFILTQLDQRDDKPEALTPPLLPVSGSPEPFIPSQSDASVPFLSDPSTLMDEDLEKIMGDALDEDRQLSGDVTVLLPSTPPELFDAPLAAHHAKMSDLMLEPPVLSGYVRSSSIHAANGSSVDIDASIGEGLRSSPRAQGVADDAEFSVADEKWLFELIEHNREQVIQEVAQEYLDPLDGTARIPVPVLDLEIPDPDWKTHTATSEAMFSYLTQAYSLHFNAKPCKRDFRLDKELRWIPFPPNAAIVNLEETIGDVAEVVQQLELSTRSPSPRNADCIPPRPGLRFIDPDDVDEPILEHDRESTAELDGEMNVSIPRGLFVATPPSDDDDDDLMALVRKRKSDATSWNALSVQNASSSNTPLSSLDTPHRDPLFTSKNDPYATEKLLSSYINLRAPKKVKLTTSEHFPSDPLRTRKQSTVTNSRISETEPAPCRWTAPGPQLDPPAEPVRLIISTTTPRSLMSSLRNHLRGVELLDRDLSLESSCNFPCQNFDRKGVNILPLIFEADIIISPSTGIIATTLLKVRQKPLPGSGSTMSKICERIAKVAPLYERLIVLVSENAQDETAGPLSETDAHAYSDFVLSTMSLEGTTSVQTFYVPGGPRTLGAWATWILCANLPPAQVQKMLSGEETKWEGFFRAAGVNVYAAQVLSLCLEERYGGEGLMRFLQLSKDEKVAAFEGPIFSTELLKRVSEHLHRRLG